MEEYFHNLAHVIVRYLRLSQLDPVVLYQLGYNMSLQYPYVALLFTPIFLVP